MKKQGCFFVQCYRIHANSRKYEPWTLHCRPSFGLPRVSQMEAVWKSCGRVSRHSSSEKQAATPQLLWACPPMLYNQKYLTNSII